MTRKSLCCIHPLFKPQAPNGEFTIPVLAARPSSLASDGPQDSPWKKIFRMKTTLVLSVVLAAAAAKFCPGERGGNQCRAAE